MRPPKVGFVLLTHNNPAQALRLVNNLNRMFDAPRIAWHHDFSQSPLPSEQIPRNVSLVQPFVQTCWGRFSLVEATIMGLQQLFASRHAPHWFILLSGSDYPIKTADAILRDLAASPYDAHIAHQKLPYDDHIWQETLREDRRQATQGIRMSKLTNCFKRYFGVIVGQAWLHDPAQVASLLPFSETLSCYIGDQWFCARRSAVDYILEFHHERPALANHYLSLDRFSIVPDESYFQTILCNAPHLKISGDCWRYVEWTRDGRYPMVLGIEDLPRLRASTAHFARKFDPGMDDEVLDLLDREVLRDGHRERGQVARRRRKSL